MGAVNDKAEARIGIIGAGYISDYHADALRRANGVRFAAVCDLNASAAERLAGGSGAQIYTDLGKMLAEADLEAVHVVSPPDSHLPLAKAALEAGVDALVEKPICDTADACRELVQIAVDQGRVVGASHNFLYFEPYERLRVDLHAGLLGRVEQIDIIWNKPLGQLRGGPFAGWMFQQPDTILTEVGPHSFTQMLDLVGEPDGMDVRAQDRIELPLGRVFYRRWEISAWTGFASIRIRFSFGDAYPEHYIQIRGTGGTARVDFERNLYFRTEHSSQMLDVDRYLGSVRSARDGLLQSHRTLGRFLLSKLGVGDAGKQFDDSIARAVADFHQRRSTGIDSRLSPELGARAVDFAERVGQASGVERLDPISAVRSRASKPPSDRPLMVVTGGTGFIGRALVGSLADRGFAVRVVARNPDTVPRELHNEAVEIVAGDMMSSDSLERALEGADQVYHLARGGGKTWQEYLRTDVEPTRRLADACQRSGVRRLHYTSTIAIYDAGRRAGTITEETAPHPGVMRTNLYSRAKVESERILQGLALTGALEVVIFRPGIVLGRGGSPYHLGVGDWPYTSVCRLWGRGTDRLPIVLVEDVAQAMAAAADLDAAAGQSYNLVAEPCLTAQEYLDEFEATANLRIRRIPTSPWRYLAEDSVKWLIKTVGRDPTRRLPSYADWDGRTAAAYFDCSKARRDLGWKPESRRDVIISRGVHQPVRDHLS